MKCPNCKGNKKGELEVARTFKQDERIERDRRCPACGVYTRTHEITAAALETIYRKHREEVKERDERLSEQECEIGGIKEAVEVLFHLKERKRKR